MFCKHLGFLTFSFSSQFEFNPDILFFFIILCFIMIYSSSQFVFCHKLCYVQKKFMSQYLFWKHLHCVTLNGLSLIVLRHILGFILIFLLQSLILSQFFFQHYLCVFFYNLYFTKKNLVKENFVFDEFFCYITVSVSSQFLFYCNLCCITFYVSLIFVFGHNMSFRRKKS